MNLDSLKNLKLTSVSKFFSHAPTGKNAESTAHRDWGIVFGACFCAVLILILFGVVTFFRYSAEYSPTLEGDTTAVTLSRSSLSEIIDMYEVKKANFESMKEGRPEAPII